MHTNYLSLVAAWLPSMIMIGILQLTLRAAAMFAGNHLVLCGVFASGAVIAGLVMALRMGRWQLPLVRRRLIILALGSLAGLVAPVILLWAAPVTYQLPAAGAALALTCIFPVASRATRSDDLFELDRMVRRLLTACVVITLMALAEISLLAVLAADALPAPFVGGIAIANLSLLIVTPLLHARVGLFISQWLTPRRYDARAHLARFSAALGGVQTVAGVQRTLADLLRLTVDPCRYILYLEDRRSGGFVAAPGSEREASARMLPHHFVVPMRAGACLYRYRSDDGRGETSTARWTALGADALIPISTGGIMYAVLALGGKRSGAYYHGHDFALLQAAAGHAALGLAHAHVFTQLRELNGTLERTVNERTAAERAANIEMQNANADLARSLGELRHTYAQLEQNHECLLRADRLATLGRLTAGIAHEVNTPLSAVQNALKVLTELAAEYATSIDDRSVTPSDHHEIAREIIETAHAAAEWADKAARFIRGTKTHGRTARDTAAEPFAVCDVIDEARLLLAHRLRVTGCTLECTDNSRGITIVGDRSAFAQVLLNLVTNAVDAYEDAHMTNVRILVSATRDRDTVNIEVRDWAGGIPLQVLPRIFDEMFTTKQAGRGTGLGLWISRTIIEKEFGGGLDVMSLPGDGSCFIASIPAVSSIPARPEHDTVAAACQNAA